MPRIASTGKASILANTVLLMSIGEKQGARRQRREERTPAFVFSETSIKRSRKATEDEVHEKLQYLMVRIHTITGQKVTVQEMRRIHTYTRKTQTAVYIDQHCPNVLARGCLRKIVT